MWIFQSYVDPDEVEMGFIARNILAGNGFSIEFFAPLRPTAAFPPFESYFYAHVHWMFDYKTSSFVAIITFRSALSTLTALIIFRIAKDVFNQRLAFLSLFVVAFHSAFIYYS